MEYNFLPHTVTLFNKYFDEVARETKYKRTLIEKCKFNPRDGVQLGTTKIKASDYGKLVVFEQDLIMDNYVRPKAYKGIGFTFNAEDVVVIGNYPSEITKISELKEYESYTIKEVVHNNYSFVLDHHFSLGVQ